MYVFTESLLELRAAERVEKSEITERRTNTLLLLGFFMGFEHQKRIEKRQPYSLTTVEK